MKAYTDIEQSRRLAEILPLESADMEYMFLKRDSSKVSNVPFVKDDDEPEWPDDSSYDFIPCWSLAALLGVLPQSITKYIDNERCQKTFHLNLFCSYYHCCSYSFAPSISDDDGNNTLYCIGRDNWVDACYEMIIHLHELKML